MEDSLVLRQRPPTIKDILRGLSDKDLDTMLKEFIENRKEVREETKQKIQLISNWIKLVRNEKRNRKRRKKWRIA